MEKKNNKWVEHVKKSAKQLNVPYGCALSIPEVKQYYQFGASLDSDIIFAIRRKKNYYDKNINL